MIVVMIAGLAVVVFKVIFDLFDFTGFTGMARVNSAINALFEIMSQGIGIINFFLPISEISIGIGIFVFVWTLLHGYDIVMFVLKKIPMLSID